MAKTWARGFYASALWQATREAYGLSQHWLCERCGKPGTIVHHIIKLEPNNIDNPAISLGMGNLELLCLDCHNTAHTTASAAGEGLHFDGNGDLIQACSAAHPPGDDLPRPSIN